MKTRKIFTTILAVITCLSSTATVLDSQGNSSNPIGITAEAATSDKVLSFNWSLITGVGRQEKGSDSCACFALAYARSILDGYVHSWSEFNKYGGGSQTGTMCMWSYGNYTKHYASSQQGALQAAYDQLNSGKPVILFVTGSRSNHHWVTLIGYRAGVNRSNLSPYDFFMTDPCKNASSYENLGDAGYSVKYEGSSGYAYVTANSGGVPLGGSEPEPVIPKNPVGHEMTESEAAGRTIPDGVYCIGSALGDTLFVDPAPGSDIPAPSTANVALWSYDAGTLPDEQDQFTFTYLNNGFYRVSQKGTDMCLDVANCDLHSGTNVQLFEWHDSPAQMWSVKKSGSGYTLQAKCSGYFLDVNGGKAEAGTNIQVWEGNGSLSQQFSLIAPIPKLTIQYNANGGGTVTDSAYYVADSNGMLYDIASNTLYSTVWKQNAGSENGLRNATSFGLVKEGYSFLGWSLTKDNGSTIFDQDDTSLTTQDLCPDLSKDTTITVYAVWKHISMTGDINEDNKVDNNDLELLKAWLLIDEAVTLADPKAADVNEDGKINVLDLTLLKSSLLYTDWTTEQPPKDAKGVITNKQYRTIGKKTIKSDKLLDDESYVLEKTETISEYGTEQISDVPLESTEFREVTPFQTFDDIFIGWRMVYYVHQRAQSPYPREYTPETYTGNNARASYGEHNNAMYGIVKIASNEELANAIHAAPGEFSSACSYSGYNGSANETAYVFPEEGQYLWFNSGEKVFEKREVTKYKYREKVEKTVYIYSTMSEYGEWTSVEPIVTEDEAVQTKTVYKWLK